MMYYLCTLFAQRAGATDALGNAVEHLEEIGIMQARKLECTAQDLAMLGRSVPEETCKLHLRGGAERLSCAKVIFFEGIYYDIRKITGIRRTIVFAERQRMHEDNIDWHRGTF